MSGDTFILDDAKRRLKIEQAVRGFFHIMETEELDMQEGLVAWNMFGFTIFQDLHPEASHEEIQKIMIDFSSHLFNSATSQS